MSFSCSCVFSLAKWHGTLLTPFLRDQERFIEWVNTHKDVHWVCMADMAREFRERNPPPAGARMPKGMEIKS